MATKWTYESVKECIANTGCALLSSSYKNAKTKLKIRCRVCEEEFESNLDNFLNSKHKCCKSCALSLGHSGRYTIEEIAKEVSKTTAKLISTEYKGVYEPLEFECECGEHFEASWTAFNNTNRHCCLKCSRKKCGEKRRLDLTDRTFGELKALYVDETKKKGVHWICECSCGNTVSVLASSLTKVDGAKSCGSKLP